MPPAAPKDRGIGYVLEAEGPVAVDRVLISFLGPVEPSREAQIEAAARAVETDGRQPVIVVNDLPIPYLIASRRPVELLPTRGQLGVLSGAEYEAYLRRRWTILRAKWAIRRDIVLGETLEIFLASQLGVAVSKGCGSSETGRLLPSSDDPAQRVSAYPHQP